MSSIKILQSNLLRKRHKISILYKDIETLISSLQGVCDHTQTSEYNWEHDNGYGRQSKQVGKRCVFCGWISLWNNERFTDPKEITD